MIISSGVSTAALNAVGPNSIKNLQRALVDAQTEMSTGTIAHPAETLGYQMGTVAALEAASAQIETFTNTNAIVATRLEASQNALTETAQTAQSFLTALLAPSNGLSSGVLANTAKSSLGATTSALNATVNGVHLFAGINTTSPPLKDYSSTPTSAARTAVTDAFTAAFGFPPSDPAAANISASSMQSFLDNGFAQVFSDTSWKANWSSASDRNIDSRISTQMSVTSSANVNQPAFRQLTQAYTMVAELGGTALNSAAMAAVTTTAAKLVGSGISGITTVQGQLGDVQSRVSSATASLKVQSDLMTKQIDGLMGVDPAAAATHIANLQTQLEASYAMTARIQKLSLLDYL